MCTNGRLDRGLRQTSTTSERPERAHSAVTCGGRSGEDVYIGIRTVPWAGGRPSKSHCHRPTTSTEAEGSTTRRPFAIRRPVPHPLGRGRLKSHGQRQRVQLPRKGHARRAFVDACRRLDLPLKQVTQAVVESLWGVDGKEGRLLQSRHQTSELGAPQHAVCLREFAACFRRSFVFSALQRRTR